MVTKFLKEIDQVVLPWTPQSPDLKIIENIWNFMKQQWTIDNNRKLKDTAEEIKNIWDILTLTLIRTLIKSISARLQAVIDAKGGVTK